MMKTPSASSVVPFQPPKQSRQHRNREVSSRFLPSSPTTTSVEHSFPSSPREVLSPLRRKTGSSSTRHSNSSKHAEEQGPATRHHQLWPSSAKRNSVTLADRISEDRIIENLEHDKQIDSKKPNKASSVFSSRIKNKNSSTLENGSNNGYGKKHRSIVPGRFSLDENALHRKLSSGRNSFSSMNSVDSESDYSEVSMSLNSREKGVEVPSKYMSDEMKTRPRKGTSDSNIVDIMNTNDSSILFKKLNLKTPIKRANSLTSGYKSSTSQWALSPGRTSSPSMSIESMDKPLSFSSLKKQHSSPIMTRGVERFLTMGFDLFKSKKSLLNPSSPMGSGGNYEAGHQLRLLENRLMQWRYANARAKVVNENIFNQAQSNLLCAWDGLTKLQNSVLKKMIQFSKQKLNMKLNFILYSQMKLLETWGGLERQHSSAITKIKESLYSVICRIPLLEGAKVDLQSTSITLRHATDVTASIASMLTCFPPSVDETALLLSELAEVVAQEKQLLEEFYDLFQIISVFEIQERSAKCNLIQLESWQWKQQQRQLPHEITS
ncbi:QWRF motif-containing protein 3 [Arachis stenosperma]|uniref:QWRF motif-containing protein 3 n=1 Tax=Arachis stenosperma TaxID=217475 RepID=UPI0025AD37E9|nr:QWRF motif-containing protein 3 [Arachis stenosperma]